MKKYISLFLCILLLASCSNSGEKRSRVLKVYNWAEANKRIKRFSLG